MPLDQFRMPGPVKLQIEESEFIIQLPTRWNKAYTTFWQMELAEEANDEFRLEKSARSVVNMMAAQRKAFAYHCVSGPLSAEDLLGDYLPLLEILQDHGNALAQQEEGRADALAKKLLPTPSGMLNGKGKSDSTKSLPVKEESQPAM